VVVWWCGEVVVGVCGCVWVRWEGRGRCAGCKVAGMQPGVGWAAVRAGGSGVAEVEARVVVKEFVPAVTRRRRRVSMRGAGRRFACKKGTKEGPCKKGVQTE
jgi:hypothetical protein